MEQPLLSSSTVNQRSRVLCSCSMETRETGLSVHHSHSRTRQIERFLFQGREFPVNRGRFHPIGITLVLVGDN